MGLPEEDDAPLDAEPPYRTITMIARSASSITYLATPLGTTRRVAFKVIGPRSDVREVSRRFERWRRLVAFQRYPGVARLHDVGPAPGGCLYLAAEYVQGRSLAQLLAQGALAAGARTAIALQLEDTLRAMRLAGVAHMHITLDRVRVSGATAPRVGLIGFGEALVACAAEPDPAIDERQVGHILEALQGQG